MAHAQEAPTLQVAAADGVSQQNPPVPIDAYVVATTWTSAAVFVGRIQGYTVVVSCPSTGTPVGTVKVQGCIDRNAAMGDKPDENLTTWFDLSFVDSTGAAFTNATISSASTAIFEELSCYYRYIRVVYTRSSGTGTFTAKVQLKGFGH